MNNQQHSGYYYEDDCLLEDLIACCDDTLLTKDAPRADAIEKNIPIYDMRKQEVDQALLVEWAQVLRESSGIIVLKQAITDHLTLDKVTEAFEVIIQNEKSSGKESGDHFAKSGANDRIWNSLQKLCLHAPELHIRYFASPAIDAISRAWLGPGYQMTAQVNLVRPGGQPQSAHRDYHLGFMSAQQSSAFPAHVHELSPLMTLQGAIAHVDVPIEAGPTKLLPFSQRYQAGYAAFRRADFRAYFEANFVQLPLEKGDCVFFNPAAFHAAGENRTQDIHRMVNLLQVSSPMGRAMESVDRDAMCVASYPACLALKDVLSPSALDAAIAATAEGYSFPTNLDNDPPIGGLAPETQANFMKRAIAEDMPVEDFVTSITRLANKRRA